MLFVIQKRLWWHRAFPIFFSLLFFCFYSFIQTIFVCRCDNRLCSVFMNLLMFFPQVFIASCCLVVFFSICVYYSYIVLYTVYTMCAYFIANVFFLFSMEHEQLKTKQNKTNRQMWSILSVRWFDTLRLSFQFCFCCFAIFCVFFCFLLQEVGMGEKALAISRLLFHPWHMHRIILYNTITLTVVLPKWLRKILLLGYICELNWNGVFILWKDLLR